MKRNATTLFISALVPILFFSCTSKTVKTEEKDLIKKYYLAKDTTKGSLSIDLEVEIPTKLADTTVLKAIRNTLVSNLFGEDYISQPNDSLIPVFAKNLYADYKANNEPLINELDNGSHYSFNNEHILSGFSLQSDENIYVYGIERYIFMGGAHGLETRNYYNFNLKNGQLIKETDLFTNGYISKLSELIKARIIEDIKAEKSKKNSEKIEDIEDTGFWTDSIKPNGNFYITDESINYVFNPYEIAPYYMGQTEVSLSFDQLKDIMKPNNIISYLIEKQRKSHK